MNADGTGVRQLTAQETPEVEPAWSPDGSRLAFTSTGNGDREIYVMNADGTDQRRLTDDLGVYGGKASWSPDGQQITYQADDRTGYNGGIFAMNADGSGQHRLPSVSNLWHCGPAWSPDGQQVAFGGVIGGSQGYLYVMNLDGSGQQQLTQFTASAASCMDATWAPDGDTIAFWSELDGAPDIYVIGTDGSGLAPADGRRRWTDVDAAWQPAAGEA